jgi:hypothetical protein
MTFQEFLESTKNHNVPPRGLSEELQALWWAKSGDWNRAHQVVGDIPTADGSWIHAYLHRVEGDASNAAYWYSRADQPVPQNSTDEEWQDLAREFLSRDKQ